MVDGFAVRCVRWELLFFLFFLLGGEGWFWNGCASGPIRSMRDAAQLPWVLAFAEHNREAYKNG